MPSEVRLPLGLQLMRKVNPPKKLGLLEVLCGNTLATLGVEWVERANGIIWELDLGDPTHRWIVFGDYEDGIGLDFARNTLKQGRVFVDSRSKIGR